MPPRVAAFTDSYLPTVNGVTYTVSTWQERWEARGGRMDVVYPAADDHDPGPHEHPVRSVTFPWYEGYRIGLPSVPDAVRDADVVHAHTPFGLGLAGRRLAGDVDVPLVASYHTPTAAYADYLALGERTASVVSSLTERYERWFLDRASVVVAPTETTRDHLVENVRVDPPVEVISNGIDVERFRPVDAAEFRERHDLPDGPLVGYTGRHGYEKRLRDLVDAVDGLDVTLVFGGDGPARDHLEDRAAGVDCDVRFLGFLDREELPAFYSSLDVFAFPSPVETQGLVALEANACGTPVVGADEGALADTVVDGESGYHFPTRDVEALRAAIERALANNDALREHCLERRASLSVESSIDALASLYRELQ